MKACSPNLPSSNSGLFRRTSDPNSSSLYETDPLLQNINKYLGGQHYLSRLGIDVFNLDAKFLGDTYMEFEMIRRALEQIGLFQNTSLMADILAEHGSLCPTIVRKQDVIIYF